MSKGMAEEFYEKREMASPPMYHAEGGRLYVIAQRDSEKWMDWLENNPPGNRSAAARHFQIMDSGLVVTWKREVGQSQRFELQRDPLNADSSFELELSRRFGEAYDLLLKKHKDYGPRNISDSPGGPLNGLLVRIHDKVARLKNLHDRGTKPENESVRDSYLDLMNYAAIALMVIDGRWPER